jgi:hypothetical protein
MYITKTYEQREKLSSRQRGRSKTKIQNSKRLQEANIWLRVPEGARNQDRDLADRQGQWQKTTPTPVAEDEHLLLRPNFQDLLGVVFKGSIFCYSVLKCLE